MGSYYFLYNRKCPYCDKKVDEVIFFTNECDENGELQGFGTSRCEYCKKKFRIDMEFKISKLED